MTTTQKGYLEDAYLSAEPYTGGTIYHGINVQVSRSISSTHHIKDQVSRTISTIHRANEQVSRTLNKTHAIHGQVYREIDGTLHRAHEQIKEQIAAVHHAKEQVARFLTKGHPVHDQIALYLGSLHHVLDQIQFRIDTKHKIQEQASLTVSKTHPIHEQSSRLTMLRHSIHEQVARTTSGSNKKHENIRRGNVLFLTSETYLEGGYLEDPYLAPGFQAHVRSQVSRDTTHVHNIHEQVNLSISTKHRIHEQTSRRLDKTHSIHEQVARFLTQKHRVNEQIKRAVNKTHSFHVQISRQIHDIHAIHEEIIRMNRHVVHNQITQVLYNTTNLRILLDFPSRGTSGVNWSANTTETGDFNVNNLNTDIVEQVWRSQSGTKTGILLTCDTEVSQGVFVDTLAILNHNFTTSASILWEGSNDPGFSTIGFTQILTSTTTNVYYIAPTLPTMAYRYHRFSIDDNTNTADYLQIGTIVFGSSIIFQGECFVDQVRRQTVHFADKIATEAFTNISNDRALKFAVSLEFRNLDFFKGNYSSIRTVFEQARTSLKCLWIPTPNYTSRYAVFGKLKEIPEETHNDLGIEADFVSFSINVDESL